MAETKESTYLDEKNPQVTTGSYAGTASIDEDYDFEDPHNYSTNYVDEFNPRGLRVPTPTEEVTLRRVLGKTNWATYLICVVELAERASYYSVTGLLTNFIQRPMPKDSPHGWGAPKSRHSSQSPGALNQGLKTANALTLLLTFVAYCVPLYGGFVADTKLGRFRAIWVGVVVAFVAHVLFIIAAIPSVISNEKGALAVTIISILTLAFGTGFIKPNLLPLILDQYPEKHDVVKVLPSGEKVIIDRQKSFERSTLVFYWSINIGAFFRLATSYLARDVGFWVAFFIPIIMYLFVPLVLVVVKPRLVVLEPKGSVLTNTWRISVVTFSGGFIKRWRQGTLWDWAKPSNMIARGREYYNVKKRSPITWDDQWVLDIKQTFNSCKIFIFFVVFFLADGGIGSVETSQAGSMTTKGIPNDLFNNFNPLTIIVLIPFLDYVLYPLLRKYKIEFRPIYRITLGFICVGSSQIAGAVIQWRVYKTSPCGYYATNCKVNGEPAVSPISAWVDVTIYILAAAGECFASTTAYELAYTRSPPNMKGLVVAIFLFSQALASALSQAITPALADPHLIWPFVGIAAATFATAAFFLYQFRNLHKDMEVERLIREKLDRDEREKNHRDNKISHGGIEDDVNLDAVTSIKSVTK